MRRLVVTLSFVAAFAVFPGCATDHGWLAEHTPDASPNPGSGGMKSSPRVDAAPDVALEAAVPALPPEAAPPPEGPRSLTFVHGVTDSPWIAFCLSVVHDGKKSLLPRPFPEGGLSYGGSVRAADGDFADLAADGIAPSVVLADSAAAVAGLDCAAIENLATSLAVQRSPGDGAVVSGVLDDAAPRNAAAPDASPLFDASTKVDGSDAAAFDAAVPIAAVRVATLPLLSPGALAASRGYLLVVGGCAGGRGVSDPSEQSVCGESYSPGAPTLNVYVVAPPGAPADRVALTVLGATPALTQVDLGFVPGLGGDTVTVATRVVPGALRPRTGYTASSTAVIGATKTGARLQLFAFGSAVPIYDQSWAPTFSAGGISDLEDGVSYTLVVVGPFPGFSKRRWWNDPLVTVVSNR